MEDNLLIVYSNPGREKLSTPSLPRANVTFQPFAFIKSFRQMTPCKWSILSRRYGACSPPHFKPMDIAFKMLNTDSRRPYLFKHGTYILSSWFLLSQYLDSFPWHHLNGRSAPHVTHLRHKFDQNLVSKTCAKPTRLPQLRVIFHLV